MAYRKSYRSKNRKGYKRTYKRRSYAPKRRISLKRLVRQEIARNIENKNSQLFITDNRLYIPGNASFPINNIFPVGVDPTALVITQGAGQGQRIGNRIKTKKLIFKGTLAPGIYDATFNSQPIPVQVKMWIFYDKKNPNDIPNPTASNDFFQNGSTVAGFANDLIDMWRPVNSDRYAVLASKTFKLGPAANTGTGNLAAFQFVANNDFKYNVNFSFDLTKHYPKYVVFEDTGTVPSTRGLFCMIQYVSATGNQIATTQYCVNSQWMLDYTYEDA